MNIKYTSYFIEIAKCHSFTKAAKKLYISQSALSKAIRNLEEELNCVLIDRIPKTFRLTPEGEIFYEKGAKLIEVLEEYEADIYDSLQSYKGCLYVGIPPVITTAYFASIIYQFRKEYPEVNLQIIESGANVLKKMVDDGSIDIGVIILPVKEESHYQITPLVSSENILIVHKSHPLAMESIVAFEQLKEESFLLLDSSYMLHDKILESCRQAGFEPTVIGESFQWDFITELVSCNQGISILPKPILQRFHLDNIRCISLEKPELPWKIAIITKKEHYLSRPMKVFVEFTKNYLGV